MPLYTSRKHIKICEKYLLYFYIIYQAPLWHGSGAGWCVRAAGGRPPQRQQADLHPLRLRGCTAQLGSQTAVGAAVAAAVLSQWSQIDSDSEQ